MKSIRAWLAAACMGLASVSGAEAQTSAFLPTGFASLSVSSVSSNVALPNGNSLALVCNIGAIEAFIHFGASNAITAVAATTPSTSLPAGLCLPYNVAGQTYLAAITSSSTTTLRIAQGSGSVSASSINGAASVAVTQGTIPWADNITQLGGTAIAVNNGAASNGTARVAIASDSAGVITTGTFGSSSTTVMSMQGGASMTPVRQFPVPTALSEGAITPVTVASGQTLVLKNSAGNLYGVYATNFNAVAGFLVVGNVTSAPSDGAVTPIECVPIAANGTVSINYNGAPPAAFSTGITAWLSSASNCSTKTTTSAIAGFIKGMVQ